MTRLHVYRPADGAGYWLKASGARTLRTPAHLQQTAQLMCHGAVQRLGLPLERVEDLIELIGRAQGQIQKQDLPALEFAPASAVAVEPFLTDLVSDTLGQIERLAQ